MNKNIRKRILSTVCAAVLLSGNAPYIIPELHAFAEQAVIPDAAAIQSSELVSVVVTLNGDAALECVEDPDELSSSEALSVSEHAKKQQERIIEKLRAQYPDLEPDFQYTTLLNAFSCSMPEALIPYAESLRGVEDVTVSREVDTAPVIDEAFSLSDLPAYYDETNCRGEGQVIAVIDTELNLLHPMFAPLPDDVDVKLTEADVREVFEGIGLHVDDFPNCGYYNSKIPFALDYLKNGPEYVIDAHDWAYHGSHVAGIAAGNPVTTDEGKTVSGVAPNAQIIFFELHAQYTPKESDFIAAIEDAVKLKADVINLSWGTDYEMMKQTPLADAINAAESAGVTVCISAGNSDYGSSIYGNNTADNPDRSMLNGFITEGEKSLAVASADNTFELQMHALMHNGTAMPYMGCAKTEYEDTCYLGDVLGNGEYEYEYCGLGYPEDFAGKDLTGKLALVDRGGNYFSEKANNAKAVGAAGVIVVQNAPFEQMLMMSDSEILLAMISQENGEILKNAEVKTVCFTDETVGYTIPQAVSSYTSWGVHNTLELRPDIMAFGSNIESASNADDSLQLMSGTSMASPYVAGCAAILNEYLTQKNCTLTGSERQRLIRNLLMTSAVPFREDEMFVTPRRQGSGMISINRAVHDKVLVTGAEGESKLSLREQLGTQFSFPVTLTNISDEDVTFSSARIELTTDAADYDPDLKEYVISGQQPLGCTADLGDITKIAANASKTVSVTVTLDAAQAASIHEIFTNGYFIEGYLLLEGAENCSDISVPLLGFSDSFTDMPLIGAHCATIVNTSYWANRVAASSYFDLIQKAQTLTWPVFPEPDISLEDMTDEEIDAFFVKLDEYYAAMVPVEEEMKELSDTVYVSPNRDYVSDSAGLLLDVEHDCLVNGCMLLDADGNCVAEPYQELCIYHGPSSENATGIYPREPLTDLPEGTYTIRAEIGMTQKSLQNRPRTIEAKVVVDKTAPVIRSECIEQNGRKILKLTAKDKNLDNIVLLGNGSGKPAGNREYERLSGSGLEPVRDYIEKGRLIYADNYKGLEDEMPIQPDNPNGYANIDSTATTPFAGLLGEYDFGIGEQFMAQYDYSDVIHAIPDKNGEFTLEYDVTDFGMYYILAMDKAFNMEYTEYADELHRPTFIQPGIYKTLHGLYEFTESDVTFYPFAGNLKPVKYQYGLEVQCLTDNVLVLYQDTDEMSKTECDCFPIEKTEGTDFYLYGVSDGESFLLSFGFINATEEHLELTDLSSPEAFFAMGAYELENDYIIPFIKEQTGRFQATICQYDYEPDAVITYSILCNSASGGNVVNTQITVDLKTGIATLENGSTVNLLEYVKPVCGDVNCDSSIDVADAVMLARMLAEDKDIVISSRGMRNADCNRSGQPDQEDVMLILKRIALLLPAL